MIGVFICDSDAIIPIDQFAKANGPAIMFPFLREHLASITLKAGISPILLPSVNFIRLSEENKAKKKLPNA
jgi:preprotein translocase subunit SecB